MKRLCFCISSLLFSAAATADVDLDVLNKIRAEGLHRSQVMNTLQHLTDVIGPRLTASPNMREASKWTVAQLKEWGLKNVHLEGFEFGRGWDYSQASIHLVAPRKTSLHGIPVAWTPGTNGAINADVVQIDAVTKEELQPYSGKLKGKIVMVGEATPISEPEPTIFNRYSGEDLAKISEFDLNQAASYVGISEDQRELAKQSYRFRQDLGAFLAKEGARAVIYRSRYDAGLVHVFGHDHRVGKSFPLPSIIIEAEHYNLMARLIEKGLTPRIELNIGAQFYDKDHNAYNTIAEIPGKGRNPEVVMAGGHIDSWHASGGAVDNGAGVAVAMEAMRILSAIGIEPRRTIRIGLWSGEEQGLFGSRDYINRHFVSRPKHTDPEELEFPDYYRKRLWPLKKLSDFDKLSVYFNTDNGSGRYRGIYTEGNVAVEPIFSRWFAPFSDLSAGTISNNLTLGTDHEAFDDVGIPGFQFIQDKLDYMTRLHHTHIDAYDHVLENDMKQASTILAAFLYNAATMSERMPREPMPVAPTAAEQERAKREADNARRKRERDAHKNLDAKKFKK